MLLLGSYVPRSLPRASHPNQGFPQVTPRLSFPTVCMAALWGPSRYSRAAQSFAGGPSRARSGQGRLPALGGQQLIAAAPQVPATSLAPDLSDGHVAPEGPLLLPGILFSWKRVTPPPQVCCRDSTGTHCTKLGGTLRRGHTVAILVEPVSPPVGTDRPAGASAVGGGVQRQGTHGEVLWVRTSWRTPYTWHRESTPNLTQETLTRNSEL